MNCENMLILFKIRNRFVKRRNKRNKMRMPELKDYCLRLRRYRRYGI